MECFIFRLTLLYFYVHNGQSASTTEPSVVMDDGASVIRIGTMADNTLLRMLGKVFMHTEGLVQKAKEEIFEDICDSHPCKPWSEWSVCSTMKPESFGIRSRERACGLHSAFCIQPRAKNQPSTEIDKQICENRCKRVGYTLSYGFCLKLYNDSKVTKDVADEQCSKDGGFVVHINSERKSNALHEVLHNAGVTSETIRIDGRRKSISDPWEFMYESPSNWSKWHSTEPTNGSTELCRVEENSARVWFDRACTKSYWFVCEIL